MVRLNRDPGPTTDAVIPDVSIVVPCYDTGTWISDLVERVGDVMVSTGHSYEIVLVNDASPRAETWDAIADLAGTRDDVVGIDLLGNVGQFRATLAGIEASTGRLVVTMDDDLQHPPEEIPKLLGAIEADLDLDVVIGAYGDKQHSRLRNLGSRLHGKLTARLYGKPDDLELSSFRVMRANVAEALVRHGTAKPVIGPLILQTTKRIANVTVEHHARTSGSSGWRLGHLTGATIDNVVNASTAPLRVLSVSGVIIAFASALLGLYYLFRAVVGETAVPGFTTIVILVTFFGGVTLASIGLLGEYVLRIVTEVTGAPRYVVRSRID